MEDSLGRRFWNKGRSETSRVLILVVMEDSLGLARSYELSVTTIAS